MGTLSEYRLLSTFRQLCYHDQQMVLGYALGRFEGRKELQEQKKTDKKEPIRFEPNIKSVP